MRPAFWQRQPDRQEGARQGLAGGGEACYTGARGSVGGAAGRGSVAVVAASSVPVRPSELYTNTGEFSCKFYCNRIKEGKRCLYLQNQP